MPNLLKGQDIMYADNLIFTQNGVYGWRNELFTGDTLDKVNITAFYDCKFMTDTTTKKYIEYVADLEIGDEYSKFYGHSLHIIDSLSSHQKFIDNYEKALRTVAKYYRKGYPMTFNDAIYIKFSDNSYKMSSRFVEIDYIHEGKVPEFKWTIHDSTKVIAGYRAQKATCTHNGFNYTAWFSMDIPISSGPWKFNGLPGLIISVKDSNEEYVYELRGLSTQQRDIIFPSYEYTRISEKRYAKLRRQAIENPGFLSTHALSREILTTIREHIIIMKYRLQ